jgi:hypothetical protein
MFLVDLDSGGVLDVADIALKGYVRPVLHNVYMELLEFGNGFILLVQQALVLRHHLHVRWALISIRLKSDDLASKNISVKYMTINSPCDLVETTLEAMHPADVNVILGCSALEHVVDGGVLPKNMTVADPVHLVAGITLFVLVLVHPQGQSALGVAHFHTLGGKWNSEKSSEESPNVVGGINYVGMTHQWKACKLLQDSLSPFHLNVLNTILPQKSKDLLRGVVGGVGRGQTRLDANPNYDRSESSFLLLSWRTVSEKAGRVNGGPRDIPRLDDVANLGTDNVPDFVQLRIKDSANRFYREIWKSADGSYPEYTTSVFKHFSLQRFLHLRNPQKPIKTGKPANLETYVETSLNDK